MKIQSTFFSLASSALFVLTASVGAQASPITVNYYTTGAFTGTGCNAVAVGANFATCTVGLTTLQYNFNGSAGSQATVNLTDAFPEASVQYGSFQTSVGATGSTFNNVTFTLNLFQTSPTVGSQPLVGAVTGSVGAGTGGLLWGAVAPTWDIGPIKWTIALDSTINSIHIDGPLELGLGPVTAIGGTASMVPATAVPVPEPSTFALLGLGLAAVNRARLRRRATIA